MPHRDRERQSQKGRRAAPGGFSLLEVLVVLVVALILAAFALPNGLRFIRGYRAEAAARQVLGDLQTGRMRAVSENVRFRVVFTANGSTYNLQRRDPATLTYSTVVTYTLPTDTSFTASVVSPEFTPSGTVNTPGAITLQNVDGRTRTITVTAGGSIRITQ